LKTEEENNDGKDDNNDNVVEDEDDKQDHQQHHDDQQEHGDDDEAPGSATEAASGVGELHILWIKRISDRASKSLGIREIGRGGCGPGMVYQRSAFGMPPSVPSRPCFWPDL
jgi:hypothetical protein